MKKLMIATAAIALGASGAYATEGCCGVAAAEQDTCKANVYQVKMSLKTLTPKTVKKNGCTGLYFDQGTRTVEGYIWTCCDPCGTIVDENGNDLTEAYQITLWEKAAQVGIINGVGKNSGNTTPKYYITVKYTLDGVSYTEQLDGTYDQSEVAAKAKDYIASKPGATLDNISTSPVSGTVSTTVQWVDEDLVSQLNPDTAPACRFGKTAEKVAVQFEVTGVGAPNSNVNVDASKYNFVAAGFGTFDKKSMVAKSVSGSVVGTLPSLDYCGEYANIASVCDEFETWCDYAGPGEITIPAFGTWTAKYVKKMGTLYSAVPSYDRQ